ncbi:unnamed protein product [Sympodiomycopsis kandeliae]
MSGDLPRMARAFPAFNFGTEIPIYAVGDRNLCNLCALWGSDPHRHPSSHLPDKRSGIVLIHFGSFLANEQGLIDKSKGLRCGIFRVEPSMTTTHNANGHTTPHKSFVGGQEGPSPAKSQDTPTSLTLSSSRSKAPNFGSSVDSPEPPQADVRRSSRKTYRHRNHRRARSPSPMSGSDNFTYGHPRSQSHHRPHQHHRFPLAASSSVANLNTLADLLDDRSGWCESRRVHPDQVERQCKGKTRAVKNDIKEYYEEVNYILDGWRLADVVVESQFPAEVMRRFGSVEEVEQAWKRSAQLHHPDHMTGYESPRFNHVHDRKSSIQSKAAQALGLGGFWFSTGNDSDTQAVGSSTPVRKSRLPSEEESGFDSDSEPEPESIQIGPSASTSRKATKPKGAAKETQALLAGTSQRKKSLRDLQRGRRPTQTQYGATETDSTDAGPDQHVKSKLSQAPTSPKSKAVTLTAGDPSTAAGTDAAPGAGETETGTTSETAQGGSGSKDTAMKRSETSASGNDEEDRDELTDLPGGKRERERLALRSAVPGWEEAEEGEQRAVQFAININLFINVLLLAGKAVAVLSSSSVSLLASLVDSALDLLSTLIIFAASKAVAFKSSESYFKYPRGKKNFEPLGVVIFSVLMIASFCQVLVESVERLSQVLKGEKKSSGENTDLPLLGIAFMVATIGIKALMWILYRKSKSSGVRAVAQDSQNDVIFNIFSLTFPFLGSKLQWSALDPIGGIILSIYIISEWLSTLISTTTKLSGARASTSDLARILYLITRFKSVNSISACEMYYAGDETVVEADLVLPVGMPLKQAHDLGEIICYCVETMPGVERAYIHLDYNSGGQPAHISARG